jgi:hypothetical protein
MPSEGVLLCDKVGMSGILSLDHATNDALRIRLVQRSRHASDVTAPARSCWNE